jgi:hypothetical protein
VGYPVVSYKLLYIDFRSFGREKVNKYKKALKLILLIFLKPLGKGVRCLFPFPKKNVMEVSLDNRGRR